MVSACLAAFALAACGHATPVTQSPLTAPAAHPAAQIHRLTVNVKGRRRTFLLDVPRRDYPLALALVFHGDEQTALQTETGDWKGVAGQYNMIVAFPQGVGDSWNAGDPPNPATRANVDDIAFAQAVIKRVEARYDVDRSRVAAVGFSDGGFLTNLIGCRLSRQVKLIVPMEGQLLSSTSAGCHPAAPVSVFEVNQTADPEVTYRGGTVDAGVTALSAPASIQRWKTLDRCTGSPVSTHHFTHATWRQWSHCAGGSTVTLDTVPGGHHDWPPGAGVLAAIALSKLP